MRMLIAAHTSLFHGLEPFDWRAVLLTLLLCCAPSAFSFLPSFSYMFASHSVHVG